MGSYYYKDRDQCLKIFVKKAVSPMVQENELLWADILINMMSSLESHGDGSPDPLFKQ